MRALSGASRAGSGRTRFEGPTWLALAGCYGLWGSALWLSPLLGWWFVVPGAIAVAFHSSLQHEILHGHPTRNALINEALVFPALGLFIPYRRFRDLHLRHHNDERLTDPYDDPESFYTARDAWVRGGSLTRALLRFNATFLGRMIVGPALALRGFWRLEAAGLQSGDAGCRGAWLRHVGGVLAVWICVTVSGTHLGLYLLAAYAGMSLIMVRSFIEHRAADQADQRTAIVEGGLFWRLLFLNNNYHAVHHAHPRTPWYDIPALWAADRDGVLSRNGGYHLPGYGNVMRRWFLRPREPVVHPGLYRDTDRT